MMEHLTEEELINQLKDAAKKVEVGATYTHYRNPENHYIVTGLAIIEATQKVGVVYQKKTGSEALKSMTWIRPIESWTEKLTIGNQTTPRFQKIP